MFWHFFFCLSCQLTTLHHTWFICTLPVLWTWIFCTSLVFLLWRMWSPIHYIITRCVSGDRVWWQARVVLYFSERAKPLRKNIRRRVPVITPFVLHVFESTQLDMFVLVLFLFIAFCLFFFSFLNSNKCMKGFKTCVVQLVCVKGCAWMFCLWMFIVRISRVACTIVLFLHCVWL